MSQASSTPTVEQHLAEPLRVGDPVGIGNGLERLGQGSGLRVAQRRRNERCLAPAHEVDRLHGEKHRAAPIFNGVDLV